MKTIGLSFLLCLSSLVLWGQYATVNYDLHKNYFNDGQPIPADEYLMFTGELPPAVERVELSIFPENRKVNSEPLFQANWQNLQSSPPKNFQLPVNYGLKGSGSYDIVLEYFVPLSDLEREKLALQTSQLVYNILDANMKANGTWESNTKKCLQILEGAIQEYLSPYRVAGGVLFTEFSEYLPTVLDVSKMSKDTSMSKAERQAQRLDEIVQAVTLDFASIFEQKVYRSEIAQQIEDYPTEKKQGYFSVNVGYGGVYLGNDYNPASYAASPYLGLSFPLTQRSSQANWLQNTAVLVGFFWQDLPSSEQQSMSGFLIEKPVLVGLDYKLFQFVRLNAGVTILEETNVLNAIDLDRSLRIQPFVGLSAKVDISLGLGK